MRNAIPGQEVSQHPAHARLYRYHKLISSLVTTAHCYFRTRALLCWWALLALFFDTTIRGACFAPRFFSVNVSQRLPLRAWHSCLKDCRVHPSPPLTVTSLLADTPQPHIRPAHLRSVEILSIDITSYTRPQKQILC